MEIMLQLLDELDDAAGVVRLIAPGLLTALACLAGAAIIGAVWLWFPQSMLAALAAGVTILVAAVTGRILVTRHSRHPRQSLST